MSGQSPQSRRSHLNPDVLKAWCDAPSHFLTLETAAAPAEHSQSAGTVQAYVQLCIATATSVQSSTCSSQCAACFLHFPADSSPRRHQYTPAEISQYSVDLLLREYYAVSIKTCISVSHAPIFCNEHVQQAGWHAADDVAAVHVHNLCRGVLPSTSTSLLACALPAFRCLQIVTSQRHRHMYKSEGEQLLLLVGSACFGFSSWQQAMVHGSRPASSTTGWRMQQTNKPKPPSNLKSPLMPLG